MITTVSGKTTTIKHLINDYIKGLSVEDWLLENFDEKSFQSNLGSFLKQQLGREYVIQYERNINYFTSLKGRVSAKSEADIVVIEKPNPSNAVRGAKIVSVIEIKFIRKYKQEGDTRGGTSDQVIKFFEDIAFNEEIHSTNNSIENLSLLLIDYALGFKTATNYKDIRQLISEGAKKYHGDFTNIINQTKKVLWKESRPKSWIKSMIWANGKNIEFKNEDGNDIDIRYMIVENK